jgi:hypothetical protein
MINFVYAYLVQYPNPFLFFQLLVINRFVHI